MSGGHAHVLVFANEKGGTGKSTTAVHVGVSLALQGRSVIALDLDTRQKTLARYLENRAATAKREDRVLEGPRFEVFDPADGPIEARIDDLSSDAEFLIIDTPGRDDPHAIKAVARADTLVTPINDSFHRSRPDRAGRSGYLQDQASQLLRGDGMGSAKGPRVKGRRDRRLGRAA